MKTAVSRKMLENVVKLPKSETKYNLRVVDLITRVNKRQKICF